MEAPPNPPTTPTHYPPPPAKKIEVEPPVQSQTRTAPNDNVDVGQSMHTATAFHNVGDGPSNAKAQQIIRLGLGHSKQSMRNPVEASMPGVSVPTQYFLL